MTIAFGSLGEGGFVVRSHPVDKGAVDYRRVNSSDVVNQGFRVCHPEIIDAQPNAKSLEFLVHNPSPDLAFSMITTSVISSFKLQGLSPLSIRILEICSPDRLA